MELNDLMRAIEAILFAAGERVEIGRLAQVLEVDQKDIIQATDTLADQLAYDRRGIRIRRNGGLHYESSGDPEASEAVLQPAGDIDHHCLLPARYQSYGRADPGSGQFLLRGGAAE